MAIVEDALVVRMEASLRKFERQMAGGRMAAVKAAKDSEAAWTRASTQLTANANRAASGMSRMFDVSRGGRFVIQNTANQLGDMAVQLESGTNGFRVMGQQLPQILGGFGALGGSLGILAPLLGTVAAIGLPLAGMFFAMGGDAEKSSEKVKTFADRLSDAEGAIGRAGAAAEMLGEQGLDRLADRFGEVSDQVLDLAMALYEIEERAAKVKVGNITSEVSEGISQAIEAAAGAVDSALAQAGTAAAQEAAAAYREEIEALQRDFDQRQSMGGFILPGELEELAVMRQELAAMEGDLANIGALAGEIKLSPDLLSGLYEAQAALKAASDAGDFFEVADQLSVIRGLLEEAGIALSQELLDKIAEGESLTQVLAATMAEAKAAAEGLASVDMAGAIGGAVSEAVKLSAYLGISLDTARKLAALGPQGGPVPEEVGRGGARDPRTMGGSAFDWQTAEAGVFLDNYKPPRAARGGRGGGRGGGKEEPDLFEAAEKQLTQLNRQIEAIGKTKAEVAELTARYKLLDEAKKRNIDLDQRQVGTGETVRQEIDRQAAAIGELTQQYDQAQERAAFFNQQQQALKDGLIDAIVEGENLAGVLGNLAKALAKAALEAALFNSGPLGGGGGGGNFLSEAFSFLTGGGGGGGITVPQNVLAAAASFDGGGYTGSGSRSGGLDGKGGFMALLHPNETVFDHTKGQSAPSGRSQIVVSLSPELEARILERASNQSIEITRAGLDQFSGETFTNLSNASRADPRLKRT
ncbi:hypothetical protein [Acidiphilium sp.]|uniref:hypothetical protein n=1 Tax=Acidiphilium sp. TaxID=527 RepID=UPI0025836636|nr:hypothetical protein [Acidiphilium sp.]